ncbi:hypothetical protein F4824DRAFT_498912 [Ustulina deusta]|nr:hypothetical protein F4824DRAFT_504537 [Ustulina deusta]KAI3339060.1 hypothetical protein F4824DRAFT_498912 [Ustulina deusta]
MKTTVLLVAMLVAVTGAFEDWPLVCISNPPMQLVAGTTNVSAINEGLYGKCRALLQFADPDFVPITYSFTPTVPCSGPRVASFLVPPGAPNGDARVIWQCEQSSACSFAVVSNGTGDQSLAPEQNGTVACLPLSFSTNASIPFNQQPQPSSTTPVPIPTVTPNLTRGGNFTNTSNQVTSTGITGVNSATRLSIPPWTIVTITHTVTTLLTTTLTT